MLSLPQRIKKNKTNEGGKNIPTTTAHVTEIRHWSNLDYTRIVLTLDRETRYEHHLLKQNSETALSPHICIDIKGAGLSAGPHDIPIGEGLLKSAKISQLNADLVRLVIDVESLKDYKIFPFYNPFSIILHIRGDRRAQLSKHEESIQNLPPVADNKKPESGKERSGQAKLKPGKIRRIVVDPGHGGKDPGAVGVKGTMEKEVALAIGTKLADKIRHDLGIDVVMTRTTDVFIPLQERTSIANKVGADLFI